MFIPHTDNTPYTMADLLALIAHLRSPNGCDWDKAQTHGSIRNNFIEETYEAVEAIDNGNTALLQEELGDVLLQVVLHAQMEAEMGSFTFENVVNGLCQKLVERHPHVFGTIHVAGAENVLDVWDAVKKEQKGYANVRETLTSVPKVFPGLMRAQKVYKRAAKQTPQPLRQQLLLRHRALLDALESVETEQVGEIYGELLFTLACVGHTLKTEAEQAIMQATDRFIDNFEDTQQTDPGL